MEDALKVLSAKFNLPNNALNKVANGSEELTNWINTLGAYILDNDKKQEEQRDNESTLRKQRLNAGEGLGHNFSKLKQSLLYTVGSLKLG